MSPARKTFLFIAIPLVIIFGVVVGVASRNKNTEQPTIANKATENDTAPQLENLGGITLASYNAITGMAGDIKFTKDGLDSSRGHESIMYIFGQKLPKNNSDEPQRLNPNFEFRGINKQIDIISASDGVVVNIRSQAESNDSEVFISPTENSSWVIGYDHLVDLVVKAGDRVTAGQKLGKIAPENSGGYRYELQINNNAEDKMYCPTSLLSPSNKSSLSAQITQLTKDWASWYGKDVYSTHTDGCVVTSLSVADSEGN